MNVFVVGLSRSGKSSRCEHAAANLPDVEHVTVSRLLRNAGGVFPVRTFEEAMVNQRLAAGRLQATPRHRRHRLVDGHALIETEEGPLIVPDWFYDQLAPELIVSIYDRPQDVLSRRPAMSSASAIDEIAALTMIERGACERAAARLGAPLLVLEAPTLEAFTNVLSARLSNA
jgi:adenylate kinase